MVSWTVLSFLASSFATFSNASFFLCSVKSPFGGFHFSSEDALVFFPVSSLQRKEGLFHRCLHSTSLAPSTPWLAIRAAIGVVLLLAFISRHPLEVSSLLIFRGSNIHTSLVCTDLFPTFSITFHEAPFAQQSRTTATLSMVSLLLPPETCCNIAGINWSCMIPHAPSSPPTQTARNCWFFHCIDCHTETRAFAGR